MTANQSNATSFNPNSLNLTRAATYERVIAAPIDRVWENVLDWEHLPWLHKTSFDYVELDDGGEWGWRTWSNPEHTGHVELTRADEKSYVARTYNGDAQISEIWTTVTAAGENTKIDIEFHFPDVKPESVDKLHDAILTLYTRLWDEDEAMMVERHRRLQEQRATENEINLGDESVIRQKLERGETVVFQLARREYQIRDISGELIAHSAICPHLLGPLTGDMTDTGNLICPWHGYQFEITSGTCVSPQAASCKLSPSPRILIEDNQVIARSGS